MAVRTWIWVAVGGVAAAVIAFIALLGAGVFLIVRSVEVEPATSVAAARTFDETLARFTGEVPLISIDEQGRVKRSGSPNVERRQGARRDVASLQVLAWDPDEDKLVRLKIPFWLLRLSGRGKFDLGSDELDFDRLQLTVDDLDRHGRGLILDHRHQHGTRVLIWAE